MSNLQEDLDAALAMASRASRLALRYFQSGVAWSSKPDGSPVTEADRAVEELLRQELGERRPLDAILGEELGHTGRHDALARVPHDRTWIIDPIDGTSSFIERSVDWRGLLDAFILEGSEAWDHAPWILLVEEAGGRFTDWDGGRSAHRRGGLFSNARIHPALATALGLVRR